MRSVFRSIFQRVVISAGLISATTANAEDIVENLQGELAVTKSGEANYTLPIPVPSAINGLKPEISVLYSPGKSATVMGAGFALNAIKSISRCTATIREDGFFTGLVVSEDTRFCIGGKKLKAIDGQNGEAGTTYKYIVDNNYKIISFGGSNNTPVYWTEITPEGLKYTYEKAPNFSSTASEWLLSKQEDPFGNQITYEYSSSQGQLTKILYAGIEIGFNYDQDRARPIVGFANGEERRLDKLLTSITLTKDSKQYWQYNFEYELVASVEQLKTVKKCYGSNGISECTRPLAFEYKPQPAAPSYWDDPDARTLVIPRDFYSNNGVAEFWERPAYSAADIDNNGYPDFCFYKPNKGVMCAKYLNEKYEAPVVVIPDEHYDYPGNNDAYSYFSRLIFIDLDNNKTSDLCIADEVGVKCALNNNGVFSAPTYWNQELNHESSLVLEQLDNDSKPEFCGYDKQQREYKCFKNSGNGATTLVHNYGLSIDHTKEFAWQYASDYDENGYPIVDNSSAELVGLSPFWIDVDGDFDRDLCWIAFNGDFHCRTTLRGKTGVTFNGGDLNKSDLFSYLISIPNVEDKIYTYSESRQLENQLKDIQDKLDKLKNSMRVSDVNADGLMDVCYVRSGAYYCRINNGNDFMDETTWNNLSDVPKDNGNVISDYLLSNLSLNDVNHDGLPDLCLLETSKRSCGLNNTNGFDSFTPIQEILADKDVTLDEEDGLFNNFIQEVFRTAHSFSVLARNASFGIPVETPDVNGNGIPEFCYRSIYGVICVDNDGYEQQNTLKSITNSFGVKTTVEYAPYQSGGIYDKSVAVPNGYTVVPSNRMLVSAVNQTTGVTINDQQVINRTSYKYGHYVVAQDGTSGFTHQIISNVDRGFETKSILHLEPELIGFEKRIEQRIDGVLTNEKENIFSLESYSDGTKVIRTTKATEKQYDLTGSFLSSTESEYSDWDTYNFAKRQEVKKVLGSESLSIITTSQFEHDSQAWILGRPTSISTTHQDQTGSSITRAVSYDYASGLLERETIAPNQNNQKIIEYSYYTNGLVREEKVIDGTDSRKTTKEYDLLGRTTKITNSLNQSESFEYDGLCGINKHTLVNNTQTLTTFNAQCQPIKVYNNIDDNYEVTSYEFINSIELSRLNLQGVVEQNQVIYKNVVSTAVGGEMVTYFDAWGNTLKTATKVDAPATTVRYSVIDAVYDRYQRAVATSNPYFITDGLYGDAEWTKVNYDALDRIKSQSKIGPDNLPLVVNFTYSRSTVTQAYSDYSKTTVNGIHNKPQSVTENGLSITYQYDPMGNLVSTDRDGLVTTVKFDSVRGFKSEQLDPSMGHWKYQYNAFGELVWQKDAKAQIIEIDYDELGRKKTRTSPDDITTWEYYSQGSGIGQLESMTSTRDSVTRKYYYDTKGRLSSEDFVVAGQTYSISYQYDEYSRLLTKTYPDGVDITNAYDSVGQLSALKVPSEDFLDYNYEVIRQEFAAVVEARIQAEILKSSLESKASYHQKKYETYAAEVERLEEIQRINTNDAAELKRIAEEHAKVAAIYLEKIVLAEDELKDVNDNPLYYHGIVDGKHKFRRKWCSARNAFRCTKTKERIETFSVGELNIWSGLEVGQDIKSQYKDSVNYYVSTYATGRHNPKDIVKRVLGLWTTLYNRAKENEKTAVANKSKPSTDNKIYVPEGYTYDSWVLINTGGVLAPIPVVVQATRMVWKTVTPQEEIDHYKTEIAKYKALRDTESGKATYYGGQFNTAYGEYLEALNTEGAKAESLGYESLDEMDAAIARRNQIQSDNPMLTIWMALSRNERGELKSELFGNGIVTWREFDDQTQLLKRIKTGTFSGQTLRDLSYQYNDRGLVSSKVDSVSTNSQSEEFSYDVQGRLTNWTYSQTLTTGQSVNAYNYERDYQYDDRGNITFKTDVGTMTYSLDSNHLESRTGNHLYNYDANGNLKNGDSRTYTWTASNKIATATFGSEQLTYGYDGSNRRAIQTSSVNNETTYYVAPGYEITVNTSNGIAQTNHQHSLIVGNDVVATFVKKYEGTTHKRDQAAYYHRDLIGSGDLVTSSDMGTISQRFYTPYGESVLPYLITPVGGQSINESYAQLITGNNDQVTNVGDDYIGVVQTEVSSADPLALLSEVLTRNGNFEGILKGYTSHEEVPTLGLINMNARHYDPVIARFISADTIIPGLDQPLAYNRYAYVSGNPVSHRDPTGHWLVPAAAFFIATHLTDDPRLQIAGTVALAAAGSHALQGTLVTGAGMGAQSAGMVAAGVTSLGISALQTGKIDGEAVRGAAWSAASAGITYGIGHELNLSAWQKYLAHATAQGTISHIRGGSFIQGAAAGLAGHAAGDVANYYGFGQAAGNGLGQVTMRAMVAGSFGYLTAEATGGNGSYSAIAAATVHLFNYEGNNNSNKGAKVIDSTSDALDHYFDGNGESVELGPNTKDSLRNHPLVKRQSEALRAGSARHQNSNLSVEMRGDVYHVGKTRVDFSTVCQSGSCTTTYVAFSNDGFWDPIAPTGFGDGIGGNWEVYGGTGYHYQPYTWSETYKDNF